MNEAPDQTIILSRQIFLSLSSIGQKILMIMPRPPSFLDLRSSEVNSDQSKACLDDERGIPLWDGMDGWDWMVFIVHRYSKSTFGANN